MYDPKILLKYIKNPRPMAISAMIFLICMIFGYSRGSIGGLIAGIIMGIILSFAGVILFYNHEEKQKKIRESLIIPKIGMTEKKEHWLRKKKLLELKAENRIDLMIKIFWWIVIAITGLTILYWISPIIYYALQL